MLDYFFFRILVRFEMVFWGFDLRLSAALVSFFSVLLFGRVGDPSIDTMASEAGYPLGFITAFCCCSSLCSVVLLDDAQSSLLVSGVVLVILHQGVLYCFVLNSRKRLKKKKEKEKVGVCLFSLLSCLPWHFGCLRLFEGST